MSVQPLPSASQRRHWYAKVIGSVPVHVAAPAVSVEPSRAVPEIVGAAVFAGGAGGPRSSARTSRVSSRRRCGAVTTTRRARPTSAPVAVYVVAVAPAIGSHLPPLASQRCHR